VAVEEADGVTSFRTDGGVQLSVSVGDESGQVTVCNAGFFNSPSCRAVLVRGIEELSVAVTTHPAASGGPGQETIETHLDGWAARIEAPEPSPFLVGPETYTSAYGMIDGKPVVLRFSYSYRQQDIPTALQIGVMRSFSLGSEATPIEDPVLVPYSNPADGYEVLLPDVWLGRAIWDPVNGTPGGHTSFGAGRGAGTRGSPGLRITVGSADSTISLCGACPTVTVRSLIDIEELVVSTPSFLTDNPAEVHADLLLGGEPAGSEKAGIGNNCLGCPQAYYHVYTIHNGRPVVLAFDYWTVRFGEINTPDERAVRFAPSTLQEILESFRFIDTAGS
jgi:hypothetical protein